jgi:predicted anti-sigma-YlaC factor YlaD
MSDCTAFDDEMIDVAFGIRPSHALTAHLQSCSTCSVALERRRSLAQRIDTVVRARVLVDPPQYLAGRIAARARSAPTKRSSSVRSGVPIAAALAAAVLLVVFGRYSSLPAHREVDTAYLTAWRSPTASLLPQPLSIVRTPLDIHLEHLL